VANIGVNVRRFFGNGGTMAITVGCFALIHPFSTLEMQLAQIQKWGFRYADITDNTDGACLGSEFGFTAVASLDANPHDLRRMFADHGLSITSFCAHANMQICSIRRRLGGMGQRRSLRPFAPPRPLACLT